MTNIIPSNKIVSEYDRKVTKIKECICEEIRKTGHMVDNDIRTIDGYYVGLFVLPSNDHLYVGYGPTGSQKAYVGDDNKIEPRAIAMDILGYLGLS